MKFIFCTYHPKMPSPTQAHLNAVTMNNPLEILIEKFEFRYAQWKRWEKLTHWRERTIERFHPAYWYIFFRGLCLLQPKTTEKWHRAYFSPFQFPELASLPNWIVVVSLLTTVYQLPVQQKKGKRSKKKWFTNTKSDHWLEVFSRSTHRFQ